MVKGKKLLCSTYQIQKYFKGFQGIFEKDPNWYSRLEKSVIKNHIFQEYQYFLAQPVVDRENIKWYAKFDETAVRLTELSQEQKEKYNQIKDKNLAHYKEVVRKLKQQGKNNEAEYLEKALKYIDDRFIYCFKDKVVLGVWGMKLRDKVKEPFGNGEVAKTVFVPKKPEPEPNPEKTDDEPKPEPEEIPDPEPITHTVRFVSDSKGSLEGEKTLHKEHGEAIHEDEIPKGVSNKKYAFSGWNQEPKGHTVTEDTTFTAQYSKIPWYKRLWIWFKEGGWKWFLGILLLLILLCLLLRGCCHHDEVQPIPANIHDKPWVHNDPRVGDGGIYDPGHPYAPTPTPPAYRNILPPNEGVLPPIDTSQIIRRPNRPVIIGNRLNILMENEHKDIKELAKAFKEKYPSDKYKVVYYDNVVKRMQIQVPPDERKELKEKLPKQFPDYQIFVFNEALFAGHHIPNDPAYQNPDKSWYLKAIHAPKAWNSTRGSDSITVAIVDNGFSLSHPEFKGKVVMPYNVWTHSSHIFRQKVDHGTHVAGTALALMDNHTGLCGIAPNVAFMPVQVANKNDIATTSSILDGLLYALYQGADVINLSMGMKFPGTLPINVQKKLKGNYFKPEERLWDEVMKIAKKHNAIIVLAAGNNNMLAGVDPIHRPNNFIVVSAVDKNRQQLEKANFSDYGNLSDVSAPGVDIFSTYGNDGYKVLSGTSMAAPIITGAVALMKSINDSLTAQQIVCALKTTGLPVKGDVGNFIQLDKALEKVKSGNLSNCENTIPPKPSTGDVQILLKWYNYNDLDLICVDPDGGRIYFKNKKVPSGGQLEIDMNASVPNSRKSQNPIENIFWPEGEAPNGTYTVYLLYYEQHDRNTLKTPYKCIVKYGDKKKTFTGIMTKVKEMKHIITFTLGNPDKNSPNNREAQLKMRKRQLKQELERIDRELSEIRNKSKVTNK